MDKLNLVVMGKTGAGKSTLINSVLGEDTAPTGTGQAITTENVIYSKYMLVPLEDENESDYYNMVGKKINLYDTVGLEIDSDVTRKTLEEIREFIVLAQDDEDDNDTTLVWFCINSRSSRFEPYEVELIRELSIHYEIPFVIVLTQCFSEEKGELEIQIREDLPEVMLVRVLAKDYKTRGGIFPAFGKDDLLRESIIHYNSNKVRILETKLDKLVQNKELRMSDLRMEGQECIERYSKKALKIGFVPLGCIPIVHGMCIKMMVDLNKLVGINSSKGFAEEIFVNAVVGIIVTPFMAIPLISAAAAPSYIETVGKDYLDMLLEVVEESTDLDLKDNELMAQRIREEIKRRKK